VAVQLVAVQLVAVVLQLELAVQLLEQLGLAQQ
jgi:hypothetical protein